MTKLLVKNKKISNSANDTTTLYNYGIPAYKSNTGLVTCPLAGSCGKEGGCYAQQGAYTWSNVAQAYENRLAVAESSQFVSQMSKELAVKIKTAKRQKKQLVIRIHDSGDFYNVRYVNKWLEIVQLHPEVNFYAYTKMVPIFKKLQKSKNFPSNLTIIYSEGGLVDNLIDRTKDRHSRVFPDLASLLQAGYDDASKDDTVAYKSVSGKIGLIYHGAKSKKWTTDQ